MITLFCRKQGFFLAALFRDGSEPIYYDYLEVGLYFFPLATRELKIHNYHRTVDDCDRSEWLVELSISLHEDI